MSMIALRIGSSKVAKVRSASLPPLPSPWPWQVWQQQVLSKSQG
jgi:hypothetical protein